jgi:hypothetical protein
MPPELWKHINIMCAVDDLTDNPTKALDLAERGPLMKPEWLPDLLTELERRAANAQSAMLTWENGVN